jgi:hypothetical protein
MARQTPAERRARRDAYARSLMDPRTGQPFRNYNALDTWQRNQKAQTQGFSGRGQKRYQQVAVTLVRQARGQFPGAYSRFLELNDLKSTETSARRFLKAFGPYPKQGLTGKYIQQSKDLRAQYLADMDEWDWDLWREEYSQI